MTTKGLFKKSTSVLLALSIACSLSSCTKVPTDPQDPYENFNRAIYSFNDFLDGIILRPAAKTYNFVTPYVVQRGVTNFFSNVREITTLPNDLLQGKFKYAGVDLGRLVVNTTAGVGGLFDVADHMGLHKHYQDFGMTLAYYSKDKKSPYLVLPFFGPSTFRDAFARPFDAVSEPWFYLKPRWLSCALVALNYIDFRARLLPADKLVRTSFDPYVFVRNAYLQKRNQDIERNEHDYSPGKAKPQYNDLYLKAHGDAKKYQMIHPDEQPITVVGHQ